MRHVFILGLAFLFGIPSAFCADSAQETLKAKSYQIRNVRFGNLLRPENANSANGTRIVLYPAQPWKCMTWKLQSAGNGVFQLRNHFTSKTFTARTNATGMSLVQTDFSMEAEKRPAWRFARLSDGSYRISDASSDLALTAVSDSGETIVILDHWGDKPEQKWELIGTDPGKLTM